MSRYTTNQVFIYYPLQAPWAGKCHAAVTSERSWPFQVGCTSTAAKGSRPSSLHAQGEPKRGRSVFLTIEQTSVGCMSLFSHWKWIRYDQTSECTFVFDVCWCPFFCIAACVVWYCGCEILHQLVDVQWCASVSWRLHLTWVEINPRADPLTAPWSLISIRATPIVDLTSLPRFVFFAFFKYLLWIYRGPVLGCVPTSCQSGHGVIMREVPLPCTHMYIK